ncbi:hypothetical protein JX266_014218 [Neoarthrinium moseri]|nr:hypothetical protein JX266_014218 [Neoarthrinium moseri]
MDPEGLREALQYTKSRDATAHTSTTTYLAPGFSSSCSQGEGLQISPDGPPVAAPDANERDHRPSSTNLNSGPHTVFNIAFQDASGISRYESGSSWGAFYAQLLARFSESHQHLLHLQPSAIETMADGRHVELAGSHANLPDRYLVEKAFDTFFSQVNVMIPILDYSQIYDMITTVYHDKTAASNATLMIIHLVLAVENHHRPHSLDTAFEFFQATLEEGSQESVQAMTIMALYSKKISSRSSCFDSFYILSNGIILILRVLKNPSLQWVQELEAYLPILRRAEHLRVGSIGIRSFEALVASVKEAYEDLRHEPHLALADIALIFDQAIEEFLGPDGMADLTNANPLLLPDNQLE